uniref:Uncharacterized protein n=1 Tax=Rhizophora mucronata TaxID=61149 RepID=A0A2P2LCY8_RHIMU
MQREKPPLTSMQPNERYHIDFNHPSQYQV